MTQKIRRHLTTATKCPTCGARRGKPCITTTMRRRRDEHGLPRLVEVRWLHHARRVIAA